jgi:hypothetical protein
MAESQEKQGFSHPLSNILSILKLEVDNGILARHMDVSEFN